VSRAARQLNLFKSKRQRGVAPPPPLEFEVQCMVADDLRRWAAPGWQWTHIPLGEERSAITGARLKRMGAQPGWPDFILIGPSGTPSPRPHFLELKRKGRGQLTPAQAAFQEWCGENECPHAVAAGYREACQILQGWGALRSDVRVQ
jgi:hypothetical protein